MAAGDGMTSGGGVAGGVVDDSEGVESSPSHYWRRRLVVMEGRVSPGDRPGG